MSYFKLLLVRVGLISVLLVSFTAQLIQADPTDDFSFSLPRTKGKVAYDLMSETQVAELLKDRLDLFPVSQTHKLARHLLLLCKQYRFDPAFVLSLIEVESQFHIKARSEVGAIGLMQLMPATAEIVARSIQLPFRSPRALTDPFTNLSLGVAYLAQLRDLYFKATPYQLVAAYNIGPAKMNVLLSRKSFRPVNTKRYYEAIQRGVPRLRFYQHGQHGTKDHHV